MSFNTGPSYSFQQHITSFLKRPLFLLQPCSPFKFAGHNSEKTADDMTPFTHLACTAAFVHHHEQDLVAGMDFPKARHAPYVTMLPEKYM
eukprot:scaffold171984_cov19-Tisochrysis_lutea.AAC.2